MTEAEQRSVLSKTMSVLFSRTMPRKIEEDPVADDPSVAEAGPIDDSEIDTGTSSQRNLIHSTLRRRSTAGDAQVVPGPGPGPWLRGGSVPAPAMRRHVTTAADNDNESFLARLKRHNDDKAAVFALRRKLANRR